MKVKVHKVELLVVDMDGLGAEEVGEVLENARYPNHCIGPTVQAIETREVEWSDDHPLNGPNAYDAYVALFKVEEP